MLDVSCGTNFIVAVIKKTHCSTKTLKTKNNYVIVHKSDSELEAYNNSMEGAGIGGECESNVCLIHGKYQSAEC